MACRSILNVFRRLTAGRHAAVGFGVGLAVAGCNPGAFDALANRVEDAGAPRDAPDASAERGGAGDDRAGDDRDAAADGGGQTPQAGSGGSGQAGAGKAAGAGGVAAGSGGVAGSAAAGAGGAAGADPGPAPCAHASDLAQVMLATSEVGELAIPAWVDQRTVATTALVRDRVLVVFTVPNAFGMSAWGTAPGLLASPPRLEESGPLVPLFESTAVPADRALAIGSAVPDGDSALVYFASAQFLSVDAAGVARLPRNGNRAEILSAAGALFPGSSALNAAAWRPAFMTGALVVTEGDVDYVYVYGCQANPNNADEAKDGAHAAPCRLARVPRTEASTGESYRYWSGAEWSADVTRAAVVMDHTSSGLSVSYNAYLGKYLAVLSGPANSVGLRWADRPQGPWNKLGEIHTISATGGFGTTFGAIELPALRDACQQVTYISYSTTQSAPTASDPMAVDYSSRFVRLEFR